MTKKTHNEAVFNLDNIRLLVAALRSGNFKQGFRGQLVRDTVEGDFEYCPLGVACEVAGLEKEKDFRVFSAGTFTYDGQLSLPPDSVMDFYGFTDVDPYLVDANGHPDVVSNWNDNEKISFNDIADMFEYMYLDGKLNGEKADSATKSLCFI